MAETYHLTYGEEIPVTQLVKQVATVAQEFTHSGGVRPFGVSLLVAGYDGCAPAVMYCNILRQVRWLCAQIISD